MIHKLDSDFYTICKEIITENKSLGEWAEIESDDQFQLGKYEGGFDATEMEFCFAVRIDNKEYWFQLSLDAVDRINRRLLDEVEIRKADW
jgi:hypothetical protein